MMETIGAGVAVIGSVLSVVGACVNNIWHKHITAMKLWRISNTLLAIWGVGYLAGYWNGGVSVSALVLMYLVFIVTNEYGLRKYAV